MAIAPIGTEEIAIEIVRAAPLLRAPCLRSEKGYDPTMQMRLVKQFKFEAAHSLPCFPEGHKCRRLHGHSFRFDVCVEGDVDPAKGFLIDYGDIKAVVEPIVRELDHYHLNEIAGLEISTSEMICAWLWKRIKPTLPLLSEIVVYETCTSACHYRGDGLGGATSREHRRGFEEHSPNGG